MGGTLADGGGAWSGRVYTPGTSSRPAKGAGVWHGPVFTKYLRGRPGLQGGEESEPLRSREGNGVSPPGRKTAHMIG